MHLLHAALVVWTAATAASAGLLAAVIAVQRAAQALRSPSAQSALDPYPAAPRPFAPSADAFSPAPVAAAARG